jgi:hypothetical protein
MASCKAILKAQSAKQRFSSKIKFIVILTGSLASLCLKPFLAKFKLSINWLLFSKRLSFSKYLNIDAKCDGKSRQICLMN